MRVVKKVQFVTGIFRQKLLNDAENFSTASSPVIFATRDRA
jgi:hypothetical protein